MGDSGKGCSEIWIFRSGHILTMQSNQFYPVQEAECAVQVQSKNGKSLINLVIRNVEAKMHQFDL